MVAAAAIRAGFVTESALEPKAEVRERARGREANAAPQRLFTFDIPLSSFTLH